MRSAGMAWLAKTLGITPFILKGGYKSYRHWALGQFEKEWPIRLLGGKTGTGKTQLLMELKKRGLSVIDLEGLANHRGSSFGGLGLSPQPTTEHFENLLAEVLVHSNLKPSQGIWLEAESASLGHCRIPNHLVNQMKAAPVIEVVRGKQERIKRLVAEYSPNGAESLKESTLKIQKRLGPQRTKQALESLNKNDWGRACHEILDYYDRCYEHELQKTPERKTLDISGLNTETAANLLLGQAIFRTN